MFALCSNETWWDITISSLLPAAAETAWLLWSHHKLLLQFSAQRSSNLTFLQVPPFKTNRTHHHLSSQNFLQESALQPHDPHEFSPSSFAQSDKHIWRCDSLSLPFLFPAPLFSLKFLFWLSLARNTNGNMFQSWNYSSLHGIAIKQNINFPKTSQWVLK